MVRKLFPTLAVPVLFLFFSCTSPAVEFEGRYWFPDFSLESRITDNGVGTDVDFSDDLAMKDEDFAGGRFRWFTGEHSWIRLEYIPFDWEGDNRLNRTIRFNGKVYTFGTPVISDLEMDYGRLGWAWQFIDIGDGVFKAGPLLEAKAFRVKAKLKAPTLAIDDSWDTAFVLPTSGLVIDINPVDAINIYGEASGVNAGKHGYMFDAEAGIRIIPFKNCTVTGGYRAFRLKAEDDDDFLDMRVHGPFVGVSIRF